MAYAQRRFRIEQGLPAVEEAPARPTLNVSAANASLNELLKLKAR